MRWTLLLPISLLACVPEAPTSLADCRFAFGSAKTDCVAAVAVATLLRDSKEGAAFIEANVPGELQRDFIYLEWVKTSTDPASDGACKKIKSKDFRSQCEIYARRPHLKRPEDAGPPPGGPGAAPPGGTRPGAATP